MQGIDSAFNSKWKREKEVKHKTSCDAQALGMWTWINQGRPKAYLGSPRESRAPILPSPFRTNVADCEFPKVPGPFAFSSAQFHEAPFQGSRRRHLSAVAAKPDGTRAGHVVSSLPGVWRTASLCDFSLVGDRESEGHLPLFTARMRLRREEDAWPRGHFRAAGNGRRAAPFPGGLEQGRGCMCFHFERRARAGWRRGRGLTGSLELTSGHLPLC